MTRGDEKERIGTDSSTQLLRMCISNDRSQNLFAVQEQDVSIGF